VNFSRLRLGIGFVVVLGIATATAGLAQLGSNPGAPVPLATAPPNVTAPPTAAPTAAVPAAAPTAAVPAAAPTTAAPAETSSPAPSGRPRRGHRAPSPASSGSPGPTPSDTPEPPQFTTLDGIWEVEMQPIGKRLATYTHLDITATGANITGYWEHDAKAKKKLRVPLTGTFDGRLIALSATLQDGSTATFSGYVEGFSDMVGLFRTNDKDPGTAFTAEHRKKLRR
jgi:hypothetical protein